jgi:RNA-directed DNA polymerase
MNKAKPFAISKRMVWEAYKKVRANKGAAGIDEKSLEDFESSLENNLYKLWNRLSSGTYFPPPVKAVAIPKKGGGERILGIPTVADRIAQTVVKNYFEPYVEPYFHADSYGYRAKKSALQAVAVTRKRCWRYDWVLEFDIKGLFDNIDHELLLKAVRKHTDCRWVILYIQRWLKAPFQEIDGRLTEREKGTPQGGVISPVLANLFLHYAFDRWMQKYHPKTPWARYADDGLAHCSTKEEAVKLLGQFTARFKECGLELHPEKTRIVYCKDDQRKEEHPAIKFDFLGYTFRPRRAKNKYGEFFISFLPGVSNTALTSMRRTIHDWRMHLKPGKSIEDLARMCNPIIRGWTNYYGCFYKSATYPVLQYLNRALTLWVRRKYKQYKNRPRRAGYWLGQLACREPKLFAHWQMGIVPTMA